MSDQAAAARPREEVEREFMNRNEPHNEGHWWAIEEIHRLREEAAQLRMDHIAAHRVNVATIRFLEDRIKEVEHNAQNEKNMPRPHKRSDGIPTRSDQSLMSAPERTISHVVLRVEQMGASPLLTDAINHLQQARELIADYVECR